LFFLLILFFIYFTSSSLNLTTPQIISTVAEIGEDSDLLKGNGSGLWSAIGEFAGGVFNAFLDDSGGGDGH